MMTILINKPSELSKEDFMAQFAGVYEHSDWVAELLWQQLEVSVEKQCFDTVDAIAAQMRQIVDTASYDLKLALLRAHPDLAGKAALAGELTDDSTSEQAGVGLDELNEEEFQRFQHINDSYKTKFEFPFIMAVKGATKVQIFDGFDGRIDNSVEVEFARAVNEVHKIAGFRLAEK
ncbi:2-oxo-4-hydroxy-4-carboxy-5-ureidoimidazoline decarboxylase [Marinomonas sp. PE14-40]|uniref:2-oxo-4-hydroxy-4-carboxy-5-ureidoimidazoline decarboxylase n=1 Tax=Marinomonas sp. PE14-40 TaxID=3060621 RepID=UPI003F67CDEC